MTQVPGARGLNPDGTRRHPQPPVPSRPAPREPARPPAARQVLCPICLDYFEWKESDLWQFKAADGQYVPLVTPATTNPVKYASIRRDAYQRCPNPAGDMPEHYLPATYQDHGPPVVIGLVGEHKSGKTHLLTAMILELFRGALVPFGLSVEAVDRLQHRTFQAQHLERFKRGEQLQGTREGVINAAESLLFTTASGLSRPVTFFDVAGEDFKAVGDGGRSARFLLGINALMFVEAPELALSVSAASSSQNEAVGGGHEVFPAALSRLRDKPNLRDVPAAVVLTKADRLRYLPPVDKWIRTPGLDEPLDAARIRAESKDVYAFLHQHNAQPTLSLFADREVRPARVLQPLLALLAMTGVIDGSEARKVGW
jgi:hypothetical protein